MTIHHRGQRATWTPPPQPDQIDVVILGVNRVDDTYTIMHADHTAHVYHVPGAALTPTTQEDQP